MEQHETCTFSKAAIAAASVTITLVALRTAEQIDWSWRWTLSPLWIPIAFLFTHGFFSGIIKGLQQGNTNKENNGHNES